MMRVFVTFLGALVGVLVAAPACHAQWGWGGGYHASTATESAARGAADVIRSTGAANLLNSEAAKNYEQARSANLDNRLKYTNTYFEMKSVNKYYRDQKNGPRPTSEQLFRLAKDATPGRLAPTQLDPVTGSVAWPEILKTDSFARQRDAVEALFADASKAEGKMPAELNAQLRQAIRDMQIELNNRVNDYPPQQWAQTNTFLKKLDYEVRMAG